MLLTIYLPSAISLLAADIYSDGSWRSQNLPFVIIFLPYMHIVKCEKVGKKIYTFAVHLWSVNDEIHLFVMSFARLAIKIFFPEFAKTVRNRCINVRWYIQLQIRYNVNLLITLYAMEIKSWLQRYSNFWQWCYKTLSMHIQQYYTLCSLSIVCEAISARWLFFTSRCQCHVSCAWTLYLCEGEW